jgi:peptide/nickel transport system permease protein
VGSTDRQLRNPAAHARERGGGSAGHLPWNQSRSPARARDRVRRQRPSVADLELRRVPRQLPDRQLRDQRPGRTGTVVGVLSAWRRGGKLDGLLPPLLFIVSAVPVFFVGLLLLFVFAVKLNWLPLNSNYDTGATPAFTLSFIWDVLKHALLPGLSLVIVTAGLWVYSMRNNMVTTIAEDYVKMARAKGVSAARIMFDYAARNAILPNLTGFAMQLGYVLGGAIVVEYLFSYPGLGYQFYTATTDHDLPLMQGLFLFYTVAVLVCVLLADIITAIIDPRTREA